MPNDTVPLPGSDHALAPGSNEVGAADPNERIEVTVQVRARPSAAQLPSAEEIGAQLPKDRQYVSREELAAAQGADPQDLAAVEGFARAHSLDVVEANPARRSVVLAGTAAALGA